MSVPSVVCNAFARLNAPSNSVVLEALVVIRKFIGKNEQNVKVLREKNILKYLIEILGKPNEKNLDVTLSILGNCCLENESRTELFRLGIVKAIVTVFNSTCRDSIQGRACRIIGNLALAHNIAIKLHQENVINSLVNIVDCDGNNSTASQQMAVRALRILWAVESERTSMLELNVVRKVALLLTVPYESKEERELIKTVIKALTVFTYHCSEQCAIQVHGDGTVLQTLLSFWSKSEIKSSIIMCIYNLCHIGSSRPLLGSAGIVKIIVNELSSLSLEVAELSESQSAVMSSLCLLCRESVNRLKIRRAGGLPIILSILRDCQKSSLQSTALHALVLFVYDEMSLHVLLKAGLVNVLVTKLSTFVESNGHEHEQECHKDLKNDQYFSKKRQISTSHCNSSKNKDDEECSEINGANKFLGDNQVSETGAGSENWKRFRINSPSYQAVVQEFGQMQRIRSTSPESGVVSDYQMGEWSPGSPRSMCFSPGSSPQDGRQWNYSPTSLQMSPFDVWSSTSSPVSHGSVDCDIPEVYSPVCHDAQSDDEDHSGSNECECVIPYNSDEEQITESLSVQTSPSINWEKVFEGSSSGAHSFDANESDILVLISRISHMETMVDDLVMKNTLTTLLNYIMLFKNPLPRAGRILGRIVRTHHYFIQLLSQQFVLNIYTSLCQPSHFHCTTCDKLNTIGKNLISNLSIVAESGYGEGELSYNLLKAEEPVKENIAVTVPFVVKVHKKLKKLLIDCKGLDILQKMVQNYSDNKGFLLEYIPISLSLLATSLKISSPVKNSNFCENICSTNNMSIDFQLVNSNDRVNFVLDNGKTVSASKTFLSEHSPVFEAMFKSNFKESKEEKISLKQVSFDALTHLIHVMKFGKICKCIPNLTLSTALELMIILDRFLMPGMLELSELIINEFLHPASAFDVYSNIMTYHGVLEVFDNLRMKTVEYLLVSDISVKKRRDIFTELLRAPYSSLVQNDIFSIIHQRLIVKC